MPNLAHNTVCRDRIEGRMRADPFLKARIENAEKRRDEYLAKEVDSGDT